MNGTSGFQEVRCSTSRSSPYRFLHEQRRQFGTGAWHHHHIHELIALFTGISAKREKVPETLFMPRSKELPRMVLRPGFKNRVSLF